MEVDSKLKYSCETFQNTLLVSSSAFNLTKQILYNEDMSALYPSPAELAHFASAVYSEVTDEHLQKLQLDDWKLLTTARNDARSNGYFGAAFFSPSRQQVVLAHRGTSGLGAAWNDLSGVIFKNYSPQMSSAATFADKVKRAVDEVNRQDGMRFHLSITGHSLGGWLAQVSGFSVKYLQAGGGGFTKNQQNGLHAHIVAFESPGCKHMLEEIIDAYDVRYRRTVSTEALDISNYLSSPNLINCFGLHVGSIYRVVIDVSDFKYVDCKTEKYTIKTHGILNLSKALKDNKEIHKMEDWPLSMIKEKFYLWGKTEYKSFHDKVKHANDYHLDLGHFCDSGVRYTTTSDNFASLGVFSEEEFKLLNFWLIFRNEIVQTNNIQKIFDDHKLGEWDKLFVKFDIDTNNRVIKCDHKEDLNKVVKRAKLLVRWFGAELMAAVDQHSNQIPIIIFSVTSENYLNSLAKCYLDFTDDENRLGLFLESEHRILQIETEECDLEMLRLSSIGCHLPESKSYVQSQTFLRWADLQNLLVTAFTKNLTAKDFANLLVIDCGSTDVSEIVQNENISELFLRSTNKKVVFVSDRNPNLNIGGIVQGPRSFESSQLTQDSKKEVFKMKMLDIQGTISSISDFVGEENFGDFSSEIDKFIHSSDLKKLLKEDKYVIKINSYQNFINCSANFSNIDKVVNAERLKRIAFTEDLLVVSGEHREELAFEQERANPGAASRVILASETGLSGQETFMKIILKNPHKNVYRLEANDASTSATVKQVFHQSLYMTRRFHRQVLFQSEKLAALRNKNNIFIFQGALSKQSLVHSLTFPKTERDRIMNDETILTATSDRDVNMIIYINEYILKGDYKKRIHFEKNGERFGELKGLHPHVRPDIAFEVTEEQLGASGQDVVIIAAEPGMGKSTSLASVARHLGSAWIIFKNLKEFKIPSDSVPTELTESYEYQLIEDLIEGSLPRGLLQFSLHHKCARQPCILFDGFDEVKDEPSKEKILDILKYFKNKTTAKIWVTTRFHDRELLEDGLSTFAVTFKKIEIWQQQDYLRKFWRSILLLEPGSSEDKKLEQCALALFSEAKYKLWRNIRNFMGVPLQMRLLADVFLQEVENYITSQTELENIFQVESVFSLYKKFIEAKYNIYFEVKTDMKAVMVPGFYDANVNGITRAHRKLSLQTLFPDLAEVLCEDSEGDLGGAELCRVGLVQSGGDGRAAEFLHRTLAEYFCADLVASWLRKSTRWHGWAAMINFLLSNILLQRSNVVIRMFLNNFLKTQTTPDTAREHIASHIGRVWSKPPGSDGSSSSSEDSDDDDEPSGSSDSSSSSEDPDDDDELQDTALHVAAEENNEAIAELLIGSLGTEQHRTSLIYFTAARDKYGRTALHWAARRGHLPVLQCLVEKGGDIHSADGYGHTALYWAARDGHLPLVRCLVETGGGWNSAQIEEARDEAAWWGHDEVAQYLANKRRDMN